MKRKNNDFDRIIREKLESVDAPFQPENWDLFEQRLDAEEAGIPQVDEKVIDAVIFDKLHQAEVPYNPGHWQLMAGKLNELYGFRRKLATYKLMELALMLLLLFTLVQVLPIPSDTPTAPGTAPQAKTNNADAPANQAQAADIDIDIGNRQAAETATTDLSSGQPVSSTSASDLPVDAVPSAGSLERSTDGRAPASLSRKADRAATPVSPLRKKQLLPAGLTPVTILDIMPPVKLAPEETNSKQALRFQQAYEQDIQLEKKKAALAALASIATLSVEARSPENYGLAVAEKPISRPFSIRIGMQGGGGYDRIITPPTIIEGQKRSERADRLALGYMGGLSIGVERGRWEVETGFLYQSKSYDPPKPIVYVEGSFKDWELQGVRSYGIDIMTIPLWIKYNFISRDRWRVYALGGASGHFVMQSNYFLGDEDSFQTLNFRPDASNPPSPSEPRTDDNSRNDKLDQKLAEENRQLVKGILEGGTIRENTFFSVNVGAGIERYMSYRWSIFTQPVYQHSLLYLNGGLGPYQDRIHNLSILMGVKVKL